MKKDFEEHPFVLRSYSKGELALLYSPHITAKAAVKKLNRWIDFKPGLKELLLEAGMNPKGKCYTPCQVHIIVDALGTP